MKWVWQQHPGARMHRDHGWCVLQLLLYQLLFLVTDFKALQAHIYTEEHDCKEFCSHRCGTRTLHTEMPIA